MTEEEFHAESKKYGIPENIVMENIKAIKKMKKFIPGLTYEETLTMMIKIQREFDEGLSV
jgi:hypothetical protein